MGMLTKNIPFQPKYPVNKPPRKGPTVEPKYTPVILNPRARPLSSAGNMEVIMAIQLTRIMAALIPCIDRQTISIIDEKENIATAELRV